VEFRNLGATGLRVSVLSFGTMSFGGGGRHSVVGSTGVEEARRLVDRCLEAGVNLFDTADVYSGGESEKVLGEALKGCRDRVVLAQTRPGPPRAVVDAGPAQSASDFRQSLRPFDTNHRSPTSACQQVTLVDSLAELPLRRPDESPDKPAELAHD